LWVLVLGDDARKGAGCGCSDAIHLFGVPAGGGQAVVVNLPRDLWVAIPGRGHGRINEAYARGGAKLAAETVGQLVGVQIAYTMVTTFGGLAGMIDELGGVTVDVDKRLRDPKVGINVPAGPVTMNGATALAFARTRNFPDGDITRTKNQAKLMLAVLAKLRGQGTSSLDALRHTAVLARHTKMVGVDLPEVVRLGRVALAIAPTAVRSVAPAVRGSVIDGKSVLQLLSSNTDLFDDLADDAVLQRH
jgi:LCP family protein required for cell wall assembly